MTMQETTRYADAAAALFLAGERVTHTRMDRWLRARDGRGCSPRDSQPFVERYRAESLARQETALERVVEALDALRGWERAIVLRRAQRGAVGVELSRRAMELMRQHDARGGDA